MAVHENLELGACTGSARKGRGQIASDPERVLHLSSRLKERIDDLAGDLSGDEQRMLVTGRALAARLRMLLLDEPSVDPVPIIV